MKIVLVSVLSSTLAAILTASFFSASYATPSTDSIHQALATGQCVARTGRPYLTSMTRCDQNSVMTGTWNNRIYCAEIIVECQK